MKNKINWTQIIVIIVPVLFGLLTWLLNEKSKLDYENYVRRETRFSGLVSSIHGFGVETHNKELKTKFIRELDLCWLYCSDEVILKAYDFLESVSKGSVVSEIDQQLKLGELMLSIRKDLIENKNPEHTDLKPSDFKFLRAL